MKAAAGFIIILMSLFGLKATAQDPLEGWTEPVPVAELNDMGDEFYPYLSVDGEVMIFSAMGTITMSHWMGSAWGPREYLPSPINYIGLQRMAAITPDLLWIYWVSWRAGGMGGWDIWRSQFDDSTGTWGDAELLGPNINSIDNEMGMCFTFDGSRIYFITDTPFKNGQYSEGETDIWYSDWDSTLGDWGPPFNIGYPVNIHENEDFPYISASGHYLFFSSWGSHLLPGWQGLQDIFMAIWDGYERITMNMGTPINSLTHEFGASISSDLTTLYFCRLEDNGPAPNYDIMVSTREPSLIDSDISIPLHHNIGVITFPNPFNTQTRISLQLSSLEPVEIGLYDLLGRKVKTVFKGVPWEYNLEFNIDLSSEEYSSGIYFIVAEQGPERRIVKSTLLK